MPPVAIDRIRPDLLHNNPHFTRLETSTGGKTIYLSGLMASAADGELVSVGDLRAQMAFILDAILRSLELVSATPGLCGRPATGASPHDHEGDDRFLWRQRIGFQHLRRGSGPAGRRCDGGD